uniref:DNA polymerase epsilon subunit 3 n=1 Tax=Steinernema glaseri TaxID=37863 RepID=A0A1I7YS98_9BILA
MHPAEDSRGSRAERPDEDEVEKSYWAPDLASKPGYLSGQICLDKRSACGGDRWSARKRLGYWFWLKFFSIGGDCSPVLLQWMTSEKSTESPIPPEEPAAVDDYSVEDLRLPMSVITRIAKEAMPPGAALGKDARTVLARSAAVFILNATTFANENAAKNKRKMINGNDVLAAVKALECGSEFEELLKESQARFQEKRQAKIDAKKKKAAAEAAPVEDARTESPSIIDEDEAMDE